MATIAPSPRTTDIPPLLHRLRRAARATIGLRGAGLLALLLAALVGVTFLTDWFFRFDPVQRRILAALGWSAVLYTAYRFLYRPLSADLGDESLALIVEKHHPTLADRLISALQFDRFAREGRLEGSPVFIHEVARQAADSLSGVDFHRCLAEGPRQAAWKRLGGAGLFGAILALAIPGWAWGKWFDRIVLLGSAEWPKRSVISVEDHRDYMARGETYTLVVRADIERPRVPEYVIVHFRYEGWKDWSKLEVPGKPETDEATDRLLGVTYRTDEPFKRLMQPVEYWVEGGDDRTENLSIQLTDRPQIEKLTFVAVYPEYSKGGQEEFTIDEEDLELVHGTELRIRMQTTKDLQWARLQVSDPRGSRDYEFTALGERISELALQIDESWSQRSECEIHLLGAEGLREAEPKAFRIHARPDTPPRADLRVQWLRSRVTASAVLPLWVEVEDDFAIQDARVVYVRWRKDGTSVDLGPGAKPQTWNLPREGDESAFGKRRLGPVTFEENGMSLATAGLSTGDTLELHLEATDFRPQAGRSQPIKLQIVDASDLIKELNTLQQHLRQELERVLDKEQETRYATHELRTDWAGARGKVFGPEDREAFAALERRQRSFVAKLQFVSEQFEAIRLQMKYNSLYEEDIYNGLIRDEVVKPLLYLATGPLLQTAHRYADYAAGTDPADVDTDLLNLADTVIQGDIVDTLAKVLEKIVRLEKFGEIIVRVKQILEGERDILERAKKLYLEGLGDVFEEKK